MIRLIIICEGETERDFCQTILGPHLAAKQVYVSAPLIKKSMGGIVGWPHLKKQIELHLKSEPGAFVTTLIDYYGLYANHGFPQWDESHQHHNVLERISNLENAMKVSIQEPYQHRFLPYIQLHEFECLIFSDKQAFHDNIPPQELKGIRELDEVFENFENPELINNNRITAPSKRLDRIIFGYNKIVYGNILIEAIGLPQIRQKCPRFNEWLNAVELLANNGVKG